MKFPLSGDHERHALKGNKLGAKLDETKEK
jgi:hypothetical protein